LRLEHAWGTVVPHFYGAHRVSWLWAHWYITHSRFLSLR
jgi:hypothetical protein